MTKPGVEVKKFDITEHIRNEVRKVIVASIPDEQMDIGNFIKENRIRLELDCKWLVWSNDEWYVYEHKYRARHSTCLYRGDSFEAALTILATD